MMSARSYANRYPGKAVRLSPFGQKEYGLDDKSLGIIVGYRGGKIGVVGSSKVAIWRDKNERNKGLDIFTDRKYNPVIVDGPDHRKGIYLLSVNCIELLDPLKPVVTYPHCCDTCGQPARRGTNIVVCSNGKCKSKRAVLAAIGPIPRFNVMDKDGYVLCPICQTEDKIRCKELSFVAGSHTQLNCIKKNHKFLHNWQEGQKFLYQGINTYIWKNNQLSIYHAPKKAF